MHLLVILVAFFSSADAAENIGHCVIDPNSIESFIGYQTVLPKIQDPPPRPKKAFEQNPLLEESQYRHLRPESTYAKENGDVIRVIQEGRAKDEDLLRLSHDRDLQDHLDFLNRAFGSALYEFDIYYKGDVDGDGMPTPLDHFWSEIDESFLTSIKALPRLWKLAKDHPDLLEKFPHENIEPAPTDFDNAYRYRRQLEKFDPATKKRRGRDLKIFLQSQRKKLKAMRASLDERKRKTADNAIREIENYLRADLANSRANDAHLLWQELLKLEAELAGSREYHEIVSSLDTRTKEPANDGPVLNEKVGNKNPFGTFRQYLKDNTPILDPELFNDTRALASFGASSKPAATLRVTIDGKEQTIPNPIRGTIAKLADLYNRAGALEEEYGRMEEGLLNDPDALKDTRLAYLPREFRRVSQDGISRGTLVQALNRGIWRGRQAPEKLILNDGGAWPSRDPQTEEQEIAAAMNPDLNAKVIESAIQVERKVRQSKVSTDLYLLKDENFPLSRAAKQRLPRLEDRLGPLDPSAQETLDYSNSWGTFFGLPSSFNGDRARLGLFRNPTFRTGSKNQEDAIRQGYYYWGNAPFKMDEHAEDLMSAGGRDLSMYVFEYDHYLNAKSGESRPRLFGGVETDPDRIVAIRAFHAVREEIRIASAKEKGLKRKIEQAKRKSRDPKYAKMVGELEDELHEVRQEMEKRKAESRKIGNEFGFIDERWIREYNASQGQPTAKRAQRILGELKARFPMKSRGEKNRIRSVRADLRGASHIITNSDINGDGVTDQKDIRDLRAFFPLVGARPKPAEIETEIEPNPELVVDNPNSRTRFRPWGAEPAEDLEELLKKVFKSIESKKKGAKSRGRR